MSEVIQKQYKPKIKLQIGDNYRFVNNIVKDYNLNTVCAEANCPNIYECWNRGTATVMILGDICTRACGFCAVKTGKPTWNDQMEPFRTAMAVKKMNLNHVVITSVDRDDLKNDFGSSIWADTINQIHKHVPNCTVEVLTPDFKGHKPSLRKGFEAKPEIFSHNIECVERISKKVRSQAVWQRSLDVLKFSVELTVTPDGAVRTIGLSKSPAGIAPVILLLLTTLNGTETPLTVTFETPERALPLIEIDCPCTA